jgi:hypothetical protein
MHEGAAQRPLFAGRLFGYIPIMMTDCRIILADRQRLPGRFFGRYAGVLAGL